MWEMMNSPIVIVVMAASLVTLLAGLLIAVRVLARREH